MVPEFAMLTMYSFSTGSKFDRSLMIGSGMFIFFLIKIKQIKFYKMVRCEIFSLSYIFFFFFSPKRYSTETYGVSRLNNNCSVSNVSELWSVTQIAYS